MVRRIDDIEQNKLTVKARPSDPYARPAVNVDNSLEGIARAVSVYNANIIPLLDNKQEETDIMEKAQGADIFRKQLEKGVDLDDETIKTLVAGGDPDFKHFTKMKRQGLYEARHRVVGANVQQHMAAWSATATVKNKAGEDVPLAQCDDSGAVVNAFEIEFQRYLTQTTGGKYDPLLYEQFIAKAKNSAFNNYMQQQAAARNKQIDFEQIRASAQIMDGSVRPLLMDGSLVKDAATVIPQFADIIRGEMIRLTATGIPEYEAAANMGQYLQSLLRDAKAEELTPILAAAEQAGLYQIPKVREDLLNTAHSMEQVRNFEKRAKEEADEDAAKDAAFDLIELFSKNGTDPKLFNEFIAKHKGVGLAQFNYIKKQWDLAQQSSASMDENRYRALRIATQRGQLSYKDIMSILPDLSYDQQDDLVAIATRVESRARSIRAEARAESGRDTRAAAQKQLDDIWKKQEAAVKNYLGLKSSDLKGPQGTKVGEVVNALTGEVNAEYYAWLDDAKEQGITPDYGKKQAALSSIIDRTVSPYLEDIRAYYENPALLNKSPKEVRRAQAYEQIWRHADGLSDAKQIEYKNILKQNNPRALSKWLRKNRKDVMNPDKTAEYILKQYADLT